MSTYYVRKNGNDSNAGTSTGAAWLTVDKAANTVAAGDTVYIGAGVYRELVTMDTAGSSGSLITFVGDVTGAYTGDAGPVIISAFDNDDAAATRAGCWNMNEKTFIVVRGLVLVGTSANGGYVIGNSTSVSNIAYEGCIIEQCSIVGLGTSINYNAYGIHLKLNNGVEPSTNGIIIRQCKIFGSRCIFFDTTNNATAHVNLKAVVENCEIYAESGGAGYGTFVSGTNNTYSVGGVTVRHNTIYGGVSQAYHVYIKNTTNPVVIHNNLFMNGSNYHISASLGTLGAVVQSGNRFVASSTTESGYATDARSMFYGCFLPGFLAYHPFEFAHGWKPVGHWEPISVSGYTDPAIGMGLIENVAATTDIVNNPRPMRRPTKNGHRYSFDGSDAAVSDPNAVWTNEANIVDSDLATNGTTTTAGSTSSNYVMAEGTNAPGSGATITGVTARVRGYVSAATATGNVTIYTDALGESLGTISWTNTAAAYSDWSALSTPTGGWTWAKVQALEFKAYKTNGSGTVYVYLVEVSVDTAENAPTVGAVEANPQPTQNSTDEYEGTYCMEMNGTSQYTFWQPVSAASTTISVQVKFDANYTGTKPQLVITNIPGVADQTDTATGSAGSYEQLSLNFTPTSAGFVRVKLVSNDTSATGKCFFDDVQVS